MTSIQRGFRHARPAVGVATFLAFVVAAACSPVQSPTSPTPLVPGTAANPRALIIAARDFTYVPALIDLVPGETVVLQVVNGGLVTHEVVLGDAAVQAAWEAAEAGTAGAPPGPTAVVSAPPGVGGLRFGIRSGERVDVTWTVPADAGADRGGWLLGCHIPGHIAQGMSVPVRFLGPDGRPLATTPEASPS